MPYILLQDLIIPMNVANASISMIHECDAIQLSLQLDGSTSNARALRLNIIDFFCSQPAQTCKHAFLDSTFQIFAAVRRPRSSFQTVCRMGRGPVIQHKVLYRQMIQAVFYYNRKYCFLQYDVAKISFRPDKGGTRGSSTTTRHQPLAICPFAL